MPAPEYATEIAQLEAGLGTGEARIESDGESVTYRGVADIMKALQYFRSRAQDAIGSRTRSGSTYAAYDPN